jgi:hypothetical protein
MQINFVTVPVLRQSVGCLPGLCESETCRIVLESTVYVCQQEHNHIRVQAVFVRIRDGHPVETALLENISLIATPQWFELQWFVETRSTAFTELTANVPLRINICHGKGLRPQRRDLKLHLFKKPAFYRPKSANVNASINQTNKLSAKYS